VADLRQVADSVLPELTGAGLRVVVLDRPVSGSVVVLEEDERRLQVPLGELAEDMTEAGVPATPDGLAAALSAWVAHRPVTDAAAAAAGVAVLDWIDPVRTSVGWRIVVRRGELALPWVPSATAGAPQRHRTRSAAIGRAHDVPLDLCVEGPVALWSHRAVPLLATAALVAPELMLQRMEAGGLRMADMHVVVTPHRPVACAAPAVAARLAGVTSERCVTLPWRACVDLPWT
jgi:hypothetical protein